ITPEEVADLRTLSLEIMAARTRGGHATDMRKIREFHFGLYRAARMPVLLRTVETLWLQTGPYMNLLFPDYVRLRPNWRASVRGSGAARWRDRSPGACDRRGRRAELHCRPG